MPLLSQIHKLLYPIYTTFIKFNEKEITITVMMMMVTKRMIDLKTTKRIRIAVGAVVAVIVEIDPIM
jgi:hypothetical protein